MYYRIHFRYEEELEYGCCFVYRKYNIMIVAMLSIQVDQPDALLVSFYQIATPFLKVNVKKERGELFKKERLAMSKDVTESPKLTQEYLKSILKYDPESGVFTWIKSNRVAGYLNRRGYRRITINYRAYRAHRLAFLYMMGHWPRSILDHRDRKPGNNKWKNLRECTFAQNLANAKKHKNGKTSSYKGVSFHRASGKYQAEISCNNKREYLKLHDTPELAAMAYNSRCVELYSDFALINEIGIN